MNAEAYPRIVGRNTGRTVVVAFANLQVARPVAVGLIALNVALLAAFRASRHPAVGKDGGQFLGVKFFFRPESVLFQFDTDLVKVLSAQVQLVVGILVRSILA